MKIFTKDLREFLTSIRWILLLLIVPVLIILLMGQLKVQIPSLKIMFNSKSSFPGEIEAVLETMSDISDFTLVMDHRDTHNPLQFIWENDLDLLIKYKDNTLYFYTAETNTLRLEFIRQVAVALERILFLLKDPDSPDTIDPNELYYSMIGKEILNIGGANASNLKIYFPDALDYSRNLLPMAIALVSCFLSFVIASTSLIREKESRTLGLLFIAPGITQTRVFLGKCILPIVVSLFNLLTMLLVSQFVYHMHLKIGLIFILLISFLAVLSSAFLGLIVSALGKSQLQAVLFASSYFLFSTLLGGFFFPLNESTAIVKVLSNLIPLTFYFPALESWMYGGLSTPEAQIVMQWLLIQCSAYASFAWFAYRRSLHGL